MKATINRRVILWIQDEYDVPEGTTEEQLKSLDEADALDEFFEERDIFKFLDDMEVTSDVEYNVENEEE